MEHSLVKIIEMKSSRKSVKLARFCTLQFVKMYVCVCIHFYGLFEIFFFANKIILITYTFMYVLYVYTKTIGSHRTVPNLD